MNIIFQMQDKIQNNSLMFDFAQAVRRAIRDFPEIAESTIFINTDEMKFRGRLSAIFAQVNDPARKKTLQAFIKETLEVGGSYFEMCDNTGRSIIILNPHTKLFGKNTPAVLRASYSFEHELGHLVTPGGTLVRREDPIAENSADAFAMLRSIKSANVRKDELEKLIQFRAQEFVITGKSTHMTIPTIQDILKNETAHTTSANTPADIVEKADDYAGRNTPHFASLMEAQFLFREVRGFMFNPLHQIEMARRLLDTRDELAFDIGARALLPRLANTPHAELPHSTREEFADKITRKQRDLGL